MGHIDIIGALNQTETEEASVIFQDFLRGSVREALVTIMAEEVTLLCGPKYFPNGQDYTRAGSEQGIFYEGGAKHEVKRPRVRMGNKEVNLTTYSYATQVSNIKEEIISALSNGVSTRGYSKMKDTKTLSKSEVSRLWISRGVEKIEELRSRDLTGESYFGLSLDGVHLASGLMAIIAVGYLTNGEKKVLDFNVGSSESYECSKELMSRIMKRGFNPVCRLFCALDGSDALKKAVLDHFPDACIQRCLVHKERNLKSYLRKSDHGECARLMSRLRKAEGEIAGVEALNELKKFLLERNKCAYDSLLEAGDELITLHNLNAPSSLNISLLSTNIIENTIKNLRRHINRNHRWRAETDQPSRWLASGLLYAEAGFRKIKGYQDIPQLIVALGGSNSEIDKKAAESQGKKQLLETISLEQS